ncbi:MAG TPA: hypothetical protein VIW45_01135 [Vicinamibacterales bacterium]
MIEKAFPRVEKAFVNVHPGIASFVPATARVEKAFANVHPGIARFVLATARVHFPDSTQALLIHPARVLPVLSVPPVRSAAGSVETSAPMSPARSARHLLQLHDVDSRSARLPATHCSGKGYHASVRHRNETMPKVFLCFLGQMLNNPGFPNRPKSAQLSCPDGQKGA